KVDMEEPLPITPIQKKSLVIIFCAVFTIVIVPILTKNIGGSFLTTISNFSGVAPVCLVGAVANMLLNIGDDKVVMKTRIPWNTLAMLWGMGILLGLGAILGVNDYLAEQAQHIPAGLVLTSFLLIAGGLSLFASSLSVVYPLLLPIAGILAVGLGLNPIALMAAIIIGSATTAMSPLSTAGALNMSSCSPDVYDNAQMFNNMFITAVVTMGLLLVAGFLNMFGLWGMLHL
ncbi:MAG: hypothetical protein WCR27_01980, partial [Eubacteriales bacterium]